MELKENNRKREEGNDYGNNDNKSSTQSIKGSENLTLNSTSSEPNNSGNKRKKNKKGKFNPSKFEMIKMSLCGIIFILFIINISLLIKYNNSTKKNEIVINELKSKITNFTNIKKES